MKLKDLNPRITPETAAGISRINFKCPCGCGLCIGIRVARHEEPGVWKIIRGTFPDDLSVIPSIRVYEDRSPNCKGWHGYLTDGEFRPC